jgi:hypothetical protein
MRLPSAALVAFIFATAIVITGFRVAVADEPKHGGTMTLTYKDDISTLDPAIGYDWQNPSMMQALFDGLMTIGPAPSNSCRTSPKATPRRPTARFTPSSCAAAVKLKLPVMTAVPSINMTLECAVASRVIGRVLG